MNKRNSIKRWLWVILVSMGIIAVIVIMLPGISSNFSSQNEEIGQSASEDLTTEDETSSSETTATEDTSETTINSTTSFETTTSDSSSGSSSEDISSEEDLSPHEDGEALIQVAAGMTQSQLEQMLEDVNYVDTSDVTDDDLAAGIAVLKITDGSSVSATVDKLEHVDGVEAAQPNFIYTVAEDTSNTVTNLQNEIGTSTAENGATTSESGNSENVSTSVSTSSGSTVSNENSVSTNTTERQNTANNGSSTLANDIGLTTAATINDPYATDGQQWSLYSVDAFDAWDTVKCNSSVSVAVIDTGCNVDHEDLTDNIKATYSASDSTSNVVDSVGHGTHVAGIVSAETDNSTGVSGVSYNAGLVIVKASLGTTDEFDSATLIKAYKWIINNKSSYNIRVINMSLGGEDSSNSANSSDDALGEMIDEAYSDGILTVCAAGNSTSEQSVPYADYPGDRDTCLSVMNLAESIGWSTTNNAVSLSSSSNYNVSGSTAKDICAPGSDIYSTLSNGSYGEMSGTSMASPLVAGIAALVFAKDESLTPQEVMDLLEGTATDLGTSGWDETYGYGEVNAAAAVEDVSATISGSRSVKVGNTAQYTVTSGLENSSELSWTWTTSDSSIATISSSGLLDARSPGVVTINVTCTTDSSIKASFTVIVTSTTLAGDDEVCVGDQASYTASPATLSWTYTSSDTNIATVASASGLLTAKNIGTVTITATCNSDSSIKITKQVSVSAKSIDTATVSVSDQTYTGSALTPTVTVSLDGKTLTQDVDYSVSYSNNTDIGTATVTIIGKSNYTGTIQASFSIKASSISMYRLYNPNSGEHFYTSNTSEKATLVSAGWHYEGIGWTAPSVSSTPVYRLYNPNAGDHFYTSDASERDHLVSVGWNYEGIGWQSADSSGVPVYRQYNPNAIAGSHNYTTDKSESDKLVSLGWYYEGVAWYGVSSSE